MFLVQKDNDTVNVPDRQDATALVNSLNELDCPVPVRKQELVGTTIKTGSIFELSYLGRDVRVIGKDGVLKVVSWLLDLKCNDISIEGVDYEAVQGVS